VLGAVAGSAIALIFLLRMRIEDMAGKSATRQASLAGFETEDVLYLLPLVTVCNALERFLVAAAIGAPLFAIWVVIDYRRTRRRPASAPGTSAPAGAGAGAVAVPDAAAAVAAPAVADCALEQPLATRLQGLEIPALRTQYLQQDAFLYVPDFLPPELTARLVAAVEAAAGAVNRNYLPGHKQGGSVGRYTLDRLAPCIGQLYRSPALIGWLQRLAGEPLQLSPPDDAHAYALYFYTRPGDHIGWHYDTSYYAGRRYTLLLGVIDRSSCKLEYQLHTRRRGATPIAGAVQIPPGGLVFFDGDRLRHRITPLGDSERRVSLTFEYVTDPHMSPWWRLISRMKDAVAYFGFRQVFRARSQGLAKLE